MDLYTQFDGEEIDGTRYALGDPIKRDTDGGIVVLLLATGRLSDQKPSMGVDIPPLNETPLAQMSRAELETTARNSLDLSGYSDDELRQGIEQRRDASRGEPIESVIDAMQPAEPSPEPIPAKTDEQLAEVLKVPVQSVAIAVNGMDNVAEIERLRALEVDGENRQTALAAIDKRLDALKSAD